MSGRFASTDLSHDRKFNPLKERAAIRFGANGSPVVVDVEPRTGWRVNARRATWTSPRGQTGRVRLTLDLKKGTFRLDASGFALGDAPSLDVVFRLTLGDDTGVDVRRWSRGRHGLALRR